MSDSEACRCHWWPSKKLCRVCKIKEIPRTSTFCTECKSHQGWPRFFANLQGPLALVNALVTVGTAAAAFWLWIRYHDSRTSASLISAHTDKISISLSNVGQRPSAFMSAHLRYADDKSHDADLFPLEGSAYQPLVAPNGRSPLDFDVPVPEVCPADTATVIVEIQESSGVTRDKVKLTPAFVSELRLRYRVTHPRADRCL